MSAFLSVTIRVKDQAKLKEYISQVPATIAAHGGEKVSRGKVAKTLSGDVNYQLAAVFRFPTTEAIDNWYASSEYQALVSLREEAADMNIVVLAEF